MNLFFAKNFTVSLLFCLQNFLITKLFAIFLFPNVHHIFFSKYALYCIFASKSAGMQDWWDERLVGCRSGRMQDWWDAGQDCCMIRGIQFSKEAGKVA